MTWLHNVNALAGGLFLLALFGMVVTRQALGCLRLFVAQSVLLALSAVLLAALVRVWDLTVVGAVDLATKAVIVPWVLRRTLRDEVYSRREVTQTLNIPTALLLALGLAVAAYFLTAPLVAVGDGPAVGLNLPIGLAGLLIGALTAAVRREAVPLFLGLLAMENSALFAGIAVAPDMPIIAEVSIAFDVLIMVFVVGVLTHAVHERIGTTEVGALTTLKEESTP
jgi:hydrogenase-4 component E